MWKTPPYFHTSTLPYIHIPSPHVACITLLFFAHQPDRLREYVPGRIASKVAREQLHEHYFDDGMNRAIFEKVASNCYYPATRLIVELVNQFKGNETPFRLAFGLSGTLLDQAERYDPGVLDVFRELADSGMVELTGETYYHSLAGLFGTDRSEFKEEVRMHSERIQTLFGVRPTVFRNTECLYNDGIAATVQELGFDGIMTEGVDWLLADRGRSSDLVYRAPCGLPVLLRNYRLSDDIGYRFSNKGWEAWPLSADTFASWLAENRETNIFLAMDYEAIGEHMWEETGIFEFIRNLPGAVAKHPELRFTTPSEAIRTLPVSGEIQVDDYKTISWADAERDSSAWLGNEMQQACFQELKALERPVKESGSPELVDTWRRLLTSDHLYYLATKSPIDQDVHQYFSAYGSPVEGFVRVYSALADLACRTGPQ